MKLHHQVRITAFGFADLQHADDVRVAGQPAHRPLLTQEPLPVLVELGGEHLDRHRAVQGELGAAIDDPETAPADLFGIVESGRTQLRNDGRAHVALRLEQIPIRHRLPAIHLVAASAYRRKQATLGGDDAVALRNQIQCTACDCVFYGEARPAGRQAGQDLRSRTRRSSTSGLTARALGTSG